MGILNFIIVLGFNIWFTKDGMNNYFEMYKWSKHRWMSVVLLAFSVW